MTYPRDLAGQIKTWKWHRLRCVVYVVVVASAMCVLCVQHLSVKGQTDPIAEVLFYIVAILWFVVSLIGVRYIINVNVNVNAMLRQLRGDGS